MTDKAYFATQSMGRKKERKNAVEMVSTMEHHEKESQCFSIKKQRFGRRPSERSGRAAADTLFV